MKPDDSIGIGVIARGDVRFVVQKRGGRTSSCNVALSSSPASSNPFEVGVIAQAGEAERAEKSSVAT